MSNKEVKIQKLVDSGKYLFVYSDKRNVFFIFQSKDENKLYLITTDKLLNIEHIDEVSTPDNFASYTNIKFYKPLTHNDDHVFVGIIMFENSSHKFKIDRYRLQLTDQVEYVDNRQFNILSCLKNIRISSYIQKKHKLYVVGVDTEVNDTIYGIVDMEKDKFDNVYHLYSDCGDIVAHSINTDVEDERVYICGWVDIFNEKGEQTDQQPYFEMFTFK